MYLHVLLLTACCVASANEFPAAPNKTNSNGTRVGKWVRFLDEQSNAVPREKAVYYRVVTYDNNGKPEGITRDYYMNGTLQCEFMLVSEDPDVYKGRIKTFYKDGKPSTLATFKNGKMNGPFKEWREDGTLVSEGEMENDKQNGDWKFYHENGTLSGEGKLINSAFDGHWTFYFPNGKKRIEQVYEDGKKNGATKQWRDAGTLLCTGYFKDDQKQGKWTFYHSSGEKEREGPYRDGKEHGIWREWDQKSGSIAKTRKVHGMVKGPIEIFKPDGSRIEVRSALGKMHRRLTIFDKEGKKTSEGSAQGWTKVSRWTEYYSNGKKASQGDYVDGKKHGKWTTWRENGDLLGTVQYKNGKLHGECVALKRDKKVLATYVDGVLHGPITVWHAPEKIAEQGQFVHGQKSGKWTTYYPNGRKELEAQFILIKAGDDEKTTSVQDGKWRGWHKNGRPQYIRHYRRGIQHGESTEYYANGQQRSQLTFHQGKRTGKATEWHQNGQVRIQGQYKEDKLVDIWKYYAEDGRLAKEEHRIAGEDLFNATQYFSDGKATGKQDAQRRWQGEVRFIDADGKLLRTAVYLDGRAIKKPADQE